MNTHATFQTQLVITSEPILRSTSADCNRQSLHLHIRFLACPLSMDFNGARTLERVTRSQMACRSITNLLTARQSYHIV